MPGFTKVKSMTPYYYGSQRLMPMNNTSCSWIATPNSVVFDEHLLAVMKAYHAVAGTVVVPSRPYDGINSLYSDKFYGNFVTPDAPSPMTVHASDRRKPKSTAKTFKQRKANKEIVLNWMITHQLSATMEPGSWHKDVTGMYALYIAHPEFQKAYHPLVDTGCQTPGLNKAYQFGNQTFGKTWMGGKITYDWFETSRVTLPMTPSSLRFKLETIAYSAQQAEMDPGLVTTTKCEANAGVLDLSTTLAELPETLSELWAACRHILNKYIEVRRKVKALSVINDRDAVTQTSSLWMQYRYSIMPNVYTIEDLLAYLDKETTLFQTVRQGLTLPVEGIEFDDGWTSTPFDLIHRCFIKNQIDAKIAKSEYLTKNLAQTAWELVPLSFVLDWVLNVGNLIGSIGGAIGSIQEGSLYSWQAKDQVVVLSHPDWVGPPITVKVGSYKALPFNSQAGIGLSLDVQMNVKRWLDAAALSWGMFVKDFYNQLRRTR